MDTVVFIGRGNVGALESTGQLYWRQAYNPQIAIERHLSRSGIIQIKELAMGTHLNQGASPACIEIKELASTLHINQGIGPGHHESSGRHCWS